METIISIVAAIISFLAYRKSVAANEIAEESIQLVKVDMAYNREKDKQDLINKIINRIVENWTKNEGAIATLLAEWKINNQTLTLPDFENIWNFAYQRVKKRNPKKSFQTLLNESNKKD